MKKTAREWLTFLPAELEQKVLKNVEKQKRTSKLDYEYSALSTAIDHLICWEETPEGHTYWKQIKASCNKDYTKKREGVINNYSIY